MLTSEVDPLAQAIDAIANQGYAVIDDFLSPEDIALLADIIKNKWLNG